MPAPMQALPSMGLLAVIGRRRYFMSPGGGGMVEIDEATGRCRMVRQEDFEANLRYQMTERYQWGWTNPRAITKAKTAVLPYAGNPTWERCDACARETPHLGRCIYAAHHPLGTGNVVTGSDIALMRAQGLDPDNAMQVRAYWAAREGKGHWRRHEQTPIPLCCDRCGSSERVTYSFDTCAQRCFGCRTADVRGALDTVRRSIGPDSDSSEQHATDTSADERVSVGGVDQGVRGGVLDVAGTVVEVAGTVVGVRPGIRRDGDPLGPKAVQ